MGWEAAEREFRTDAEPVETLPRAFEQTADDNGDRVAQRYKGGVYDRSLCAAGILDPAPAGEYADVSYDELRSIVRRLAAGFREIGVDAGGRVAIHSHTRAEWAHADLGILAAGGVVTTVHPSASRSRLRTLLAGTRASVVVTENRSTLEAVGSVSDDLDHGIEAIVVVDDDADVLPGSDHDDADRFPGSDHDGPDVYTLGALHDVGDDAFERSRYESWLDAVDPDDLASVVYTSGTTGAPKGVRLTHANLRTNVRQCRARLADRPDRPADVPGIGPESTTLSFLPLSHVFERLAGQYVPLASGATVAYAESPDTLREDFALVRPTMMTGVPRVYEKLYEAARETAADSPGGERIFEWAIAVGRDHHEATDPGIVLEAKRAIADRLVFSSVREAVGGNMELLIAGGGSLSAELCAAYHAMELPILEGYGLTETSPVVSVNPPEAPAVGTIGPPLVDTEVAIVDRDDVDVEHVARGDAGKTNNDAANVDGEPADPGDVDGEPADAVGELLVRGPQVTEGYWNRPDATEEAFLDPDRLPDDAVVAGTPPAERNGDPDEPWFRTGDIVKRRPDGYLAFVERAKQLIVLSTGRSVAPTPIENRFVTNEFIDQCVVLGDDRRFVSALFVPNVDRVLDWAATEGIDLPSDRAAICRDDRVHRRIHEVVDRVNEEFEPHERIKRFRLVDEAFSTENDLLTLTMKTKRRNVRDRFGDEIAAIYEDDE